MAEIGRDISPDADILIAIDNKRICLAVEIEISNRSTARATEIQKARFLRPLDKIAIGILQ